MQKFQIRNNRDVTVRTVEATSYRHVDGYFHFFNVDKQVLTISAGTVSIIEEVSEKK